MNPEQARSIRNKKRLEEQLNIKDLDKFDVDKEDGSSLKVLKEAERAYRKEDKEVGGNEADKMAYFGYKVDAFHMKGDRETGVIHEDGFVELKKKKRDDDEERDDWLEGLEEDEEAGGTINVKRPLPDNESDGEEAQPLDPKEMFHLTKELFDLLHPSETPNQAMKRLCPTQAQPQKRAPKKNVRKNVKTEQNSEQYNMLDKDGAKVEKSEENKEADEAKKKAFDKIVETCNMLAGNGYLTVYSDTREKIRNKFMKVEDELITHDLEDEGKVEDMNPDHNVIEK